MSHTKGKWEISSYRHGEIWVGANYHIATCHRGSISDEECQANARLIAAAPETAQQRDDLLAACRLLIEENKYAQFVSLMDNPPRGSIWGACRSSMAAARLKAEVVIKAIASVQKAKVIL